MKIIDLQDAPGFDSQRSPSNGRDSVSQGFVFVKTYPFGNYPHCRKHGAMLKVDAVGTWRCPTCHVGCWEAAPIHNAIFRIRTLLEKSKEFISKLDSYNFSLNWICPCKTENEKKDWYCKNCGWLKSNNA